MLEANLQRDAQLWRPIEYLVWVFYVAAGTMLLWLSPPQYLVISLPSLSLGLVFLLATFHYLIPHFWPQPWLVYGCLLGALVCLAIGNYWARLIGLYLDPFFIFLILIFAVTTNARVALVCAILSAASVLVEAAITADFTSNLVPQTLVNLLTFVTSALLASHLARFLTTAWRESAQTAERRRARLEQLHALSEQITRAREPEAIYQAIYESARSLIPSDAFFIALYDKKNQTRNTVFMVDQDKHYPPRTDPLDQGMTSYVIRHGESVVVPDLATETRFQMAHWGGAQSVASTICAPMKLGDKVVGALSAQSYQRNAFTRDDIALLETLGSPAAIAIENAHLIESLRESSELNARLYEKENHRVTLLQIVAHVARSVNTLLDLDQLTSEMVARIHEAFGYDDTHVFINDPERGETVMKASTPPDDPSEKWDELRLPIGKSSIVGWVAASGKPIIANDVSLEPLYVAHPLRPLTRAELALPLRVGDNVLGVLDIQSHSLNAFTPEDVAAVETLTNQLATAIDNARHHAEVQKLARLDSLTQVCNHGYFLARLDEQVALAQRENYDVALIMLDIDYFKHYNDTYGHVTGDLVLRTLVQAIRANVKQTDVVGRWGGEEFGIVLPHADLQQALLVAERIRLTLANLRLDVKGKPVRVPTVSQGIGVYPQHASNADELVDVADRALYAAKSAGRDEIRVAM